jgi:ribosomal protein L7/L12
MTLPDDVTEALARGDKLEAIKRLRESSGLGLQEAKAAVEGHLRGQPAQAIFTPGGELPADVVATMRSGNKIAAIGLLRERTGMGLAAAKEAVEAIRLERPGGQAGLSPGEVPRGRGGLGWLAAAAVLAAIAAAYFLR